MPVGIIMAVGSLVLAGTEAPAGASVHPGPTVKKALSEAPVHGQVSATRSATRTVKVKQTRTVTARYRSTSAKATVGRVSRVTTKIAVIRYAPTLRQAVDEALSVAAKAARARSTARATDRAAAAAKKAATRKAKATARAKYERTHRAAFGTRVLREAARLRGRPYRYGATGPGSFDCSGFVGYVMRKAGVKGVPRTSGAIASRARAVAKSHKRAGDVIIISSGSRVSHVGIYAGNGKMWDAPGSGRTVQKRAIYTSRYRVGRLAA
jgi:cell wall-associated NlpC family hydrolase